MALAALVLGFGAGWVVGDQTAQPSQHFRRCVEQLMECRAAEDHSVQEFGEPEVEP